MNTSYLAVNGTSVTWREATSADVAADDSYAWYLRFDPKKQHYSLRNASTGQWLTLSGTTFKTVSRTTPTDAEKFHFMTGRRDVKVGSGTSAFNVRGYWILRANGSGWANAMTASSNGKLTSTSFNNAADAATQHWVILTGEETQAFDEAMRGTVLNELKTLIKNFRAVKQTPHKEEIADVDATFEAVLVSAETVVADASASIDALSAACTSLRQAGMEFLATATPTDKDNPFDITFLIADAAITTGQGWSVARTVSSSVVEFFEMTFDFNQTIMGLPAATYVLKVQAFNRPGAAQTAYTNYHKGTNKVATKLYAGKNDMKVCHFAEGAGRSKLHNDDLPMSSPKGYVPDTKASAAAYFGKGRYDNELLFSIDETTDLKIGVKFTSTTIDKTAHWTVIDNFRLYSYGSSTPEEDEPTKLPSVEVGSEGSDSVVYNIFGQKVADSLEDLPRGLYISGGKKIWIK